VVRITARLVLIVSSSTTALVLAVKWRISRPSTIRAYSRHCILSLRCIVATENVDASG
jgi:hypothetical protein